MTIPCVRSAVQSITRGVGNGGRGPGGGHEEPCPACRRINDRFPAGVVELRGAFGIQQKEEILRLARHQEEAEKSEHPLNRIIKIDEGAATGSSSTRQTSTCRAESAKPCNALSTAPSMRVSMKVDTSYASIGR